MEEYKSKLEGVLNPKTGKNILEENRLVSLRVENDILKIIYNRNDISVEDKMKINNEIYKTFENDFSDDNIEIQTVSSKTNLKAAGDVQTKKTSDDKPANLEVGHQKAAPKKRVQNVKKVIAVASGKGGVGKSTVSVNLALALKELGHKVGIIDGDLYGPSIPMLLGKRDAKPKGTEAKKIIPIEAHGLHFISFGLFIPESEPLVWRGPMLGGVISQFLFDVDWPELDYLILDLPPGTGDIQLSLSQLAETDGAIIVSTPQDVALLDATKGLKMFEKVKIPVLGMVENMSSFICDSCDKEHFIFGKDGVQKESEKLGISYFGGIPLDMSIREGADEGIPFMSKGEKGNLVYDAYMSIANSLVAKFEGGKKSKGIFGKLFKK